MYDGFKWIVTGVLGQQEEHIKFVCSLYEWDNRYEENH